MAQAWRQGNDGLARVGQRGRDIRLSHIVC
jgi:hypothetical protein